MVVCAMQGYKLFGRALDTKGIIISCLVSIAMVLVAEHLSLAVEIYKTYDTVFTHMTFMEAVQSVPEFMEYDEIKDAVVYDLIMGYLLMVVGAASTVFEAFKKSRSTVETNELQNGNHSGRSGCKVSDRSSSEGSYRRTDCGAGNRGSVRTPYQDGVVRNQKL